jgi:uncharacterized protein YkwD
MHRQQPRVQRRVVARTVAFGASALVAAALLAWSPSVTSGWNQGSAESTLWQLMNGARVNNGRAPVQQHGTLVSLARWRSSDMLAKNYFSHTIPGCGCLVYTYYDANGLAYDWAGENIGWNSGFDDASSPVRIHEGFMGSPGHRANVLDPSFTHGGVGAAAADDRMFLGSVQDTKMYTQLFMDAKSAAAPPPPPSTNPPPSSGGGGGAAPPSQGPARAADPTPKRATMDAPQAPTSTAGIDGVWTTVSEREPGHLLALRRAEGRASAPDAGQAPPAATAADSEEVAGMQVAGAPRAPGLLEGVIGTVLGFLFG